MLAINARLSPCSPRDRFESSRRATESVLPSTVTLTAASSVRVSVPLGPSTRTPPSRIWTFTPSGSVTGIRPMRDMIPLPHGADELAAHVLAPRISVDQNPFGRGQDVRPESLADLGDVPDADVHPQARLAHPSDAFDDGAAPRIVAQRDAQDPARPIVDHRRGVDVPLPDEHGGDFLLDARKRHVDASLARPRAVADAGEHVGDRIRQHAVTNSPSRGPESGPSAPAPASRGGIAGTVDRSSAGGRTASSGCTPAP